MQRLHPAYPAQLHIHTEMHNGHTETCKESLPYVNLLLIWLEVMELSVSLTQMSDTIFPSFAYLLLLQKTYQTYSVVAYSRTEGAFRHF